MDVLISAIAGAVLGGAIAWFVALRSAAYGRETALEVWRARGAGA